MANYFELKEFLVSDTAKALGIDNTPSFEVVTNLKNLCDEVLNPLRAAWGSGIKVTSGYRCPKLNKAVGGVSQSVHQVGLAADLVPSNGKINEFLTFATDWISKNCEFDQVIKEKQGQRKWLHVGLRSLTGAQRHQVLNITK